MILPVCIFFPKHIHACKVYIKEKTALVPKICIHYGCKYKKEEDYNEEEEEQQKKQKSVFAKNFIKFRYSRE
jgi:hypothetical protein